MKKSQNLLHIKLESDEATQSMKDILKTEADLIKIAQSIKSYRTLRIMELELKIELHKKIKDFRNNMHKLRTLLPRLEIPKILKNHEEEIHRTEIMEEVAKIEKEIKPKKEKVQKLREEEPKAPVDDLEAQLREIQERLSRLE